MVMVFTVKSMCKEQLFKSHNSTLILPIHYLIFLIGRIIPQTPTSASSFYRYDPRPPINTFLSYVCWA